MRRINHPVTINHLSRGVLSNDDNCILIWESTEGTPAHSTVICPSSRKASLADACPRRGSVINYRSSELSGGCQLMKSGYQPNAEPPENLVAFDAI